MSSVKHWGEIDPLEDEDKKEIDNKLLEDTLTKLSIGGPMKLHQPYSSEDESLMEVSSECSKMEDNVVQSIKLFERIRSHYDSGSSKSSSANFSKEADINFLNQEVSMDTEEADMQEKMYKYKIKQNLMDFDKEYSSFPQAPPAPPELRSYVARQILQKSVAALIAHNGYETSMQSALETITDVAHHFIIRITKLLKLAVDLEDGANAHGFPDAVEWAFYQAGLGSVTTLHQYYQEQILNHRAHLESVVKELPTPPPNTESNPVVSQEEDPIRVTIKEEVQDDEDDIPEIHFPALGNGEASEEIQSTLEPGFQMLHNLEEGGLG